MTLELELRRNGGVMRSSRLLDLGWSTHAQSVAVRSERLIRPSIGWLALADADPMLLFAVRRRAVLTCITQAKRLGLWVLAECEPHLAAPRRGSKPNGEGCIVHWNRPFIPRRPDAIQDPIENVLGQVAICQPFEAALVIWDSALNKRLIDKATLGQFPLGPQGRTLLARSISVADSGLESLVRSRLRFLRVRMIAQAWVLGHRVDFLIGDRLVLQIDGSHHVGLQRSADIRHDAELRLRDYTVIRVSYEQIVNDWPHTQDLLMRAVAQGLHLAAQSPRV